MAKQFHFEYLDGAKGWREQDYEYDSSGVTMPEEFVTRWNDAQAVIKALEQELHQAERESNA